MGRSIDIDKRFLDYIERKKQTEKIGANIETRLTIPDSSGLKSHEADVVLIVDTYHHIEERVEYLRRLKECLREGGMLVIIEFKKEKTPPGPPVELRLAQELSIHRQGTLIDETLAKRTDHLH